ncbi:MAG: aspartate 1-decarboxylase [Verrucomicrobiae bacterium]|nr:aspartate 1-decarboxylase [Verrucomicrobiae bacterium]
MQVQVLKSKIHRACVTACDPNYEGSLSIDQDLMDLAGLLPYERVLCGNLTNGERFETYAIPAPRGSRTIGLNGAAALLGKVGDRIIIMSFATVDAAKAKNWEPRCVVVDEKNVVIKSSGESAHGRGAAKQKPKRARAR